MEGRINNVTQYVDQCILFLSHFIHGIYTIQATLILNIKTQSTTSRYHVNCKKQPFCAINLRFLFFNLIWYNWKNKSMTELTWLNVLFICIMGMLGTH